MTTNEVNNYSQQNICYRVNQDGFPSPFVLQYVAHCPSPGLFQSTAFPAQDYAPPLCPSSTSTIVEPAEPRSLSMLQGQLRFPCKARGIDAKHNDANAYIEVSNSTDHGTLLVCSNLLCASSGRRFRWCSVCKVPAAKVCFTSGLLHQSEKHLSLTLFQPVTEELHETTFSWHNHFKSLHTQRLP